MRLPSRHVVDVTVFWSSSGGGGVERYLRNKRAWLQATEPTSALWRHSIVVPGRNDASGTLGEPGIFGIPGLPLPFSGGYRFPLRRRPAADAIAALAPDLIEVGDPYRLAWSSLDVGQRLGVPVAAFCHSNIATLAQRYLGGTADALARRYIRHLYGNFDRIYAASDWTLQLLRELGLSRAARFPLGVDCRNFHPAQSDWQWRQSLGLPDDSRVLLYVGRFAPEKNLPHIVQAVQRLGAPYVLVAIGAGPKPPRGERVIVLPYEANERALARAIASADLLVHAGDQETFGLALLEALACGTPAVVRAAAGLREFVDDQSVVGVEGSDSTALVAGFADAIDAMFAQQRISGLHQADADASSMLRQNLPLRQRARQRALLYDLRRTFQAQFDDYAQLCQRAARSQSHPTPPRIGHGADHAAATGADRPRLHAA